MQVYVCITAVEMHAGVCITAVEMHAGICMYNCSRDACRYMYV